MMTKFTIIETEDLAPHRLTAPVRSAPHKARYTIVVTNPIDKDATIRLTLQGPKFRNDPYVFDAVVTIAGEDNGREYTMNRSSSNPLEAAKAFYQERVNEDVAPE